MAEHRKAKSLSLKRPRVTSSDTETSTKKNKAVNRPPAATSLDKENGKRNKTAEGPRAPPESIITMDNSKESDGKDDRYLFDVTNDDLVRFKEGECAANTENNTKWAIKNFESWRLARNQRYPDEQCSCNVYSEADSNELCDWLCKYVTETRKVDGSEYTPRTLYLLLAGIQRHIRKVNPSKSINIFQDVEFKPLKHVCDSVFKRLHTKGIGTETKSTAVLSVTEEDKLWETGVISLDTPAGLLNAVFSTTAKIFA